MLISIPVANSEKLKLSLVRENSVTSSTYGRQLECCWERSETKRREPMTDDMRFHA